MMILLVALFVFVGFFILGFVIFYNRLIKLRNLVKQRWLDVDLQLKRRSELLAKLLETIKNSMSQDKEILPKVTQLHSQAMQAKDIAHRIQSEIALTTSLTTLLVAAKNSSDLNTNANFIELQKALTEVNDNLQHSIQNYNDVADDYNNAVESFPSNIVANSFAFKLAEHFDITPKQASGTAVAE